MSSIGSGDTLYSSPIYKGLISLNDGEMQAYEVLDDEGIENVKLFVSNFFSSKEVKSEEKQKILNGLEQFEKKMASHSTMQKEIELLESFVKNIKETYGIK